MPSKLDGITAAAAYAELCHNASCNTAAQGAPHLVHWEQHPAALGAQHPAAQGAGAQLPVAQGAQHPVHWECKTQLHKERNTQHTGSVQQNVESMHACMFSSQTESVVCMLACLQLNQHLSTRTFLVGTHAPTVADLVIFAVTLPATAPCQLWCLQPISLVPANNVRSIIWVAKWVALGNRTASYALFGRILQSEHMCKAGRFTWQLATNYAIMNAGGEREAEPWSTTPQLPALLPLCLQTTLPVAQHHQLANLLRWADTVQGSIGEHTVLQFVHPRLHGLGSKSKPAAMGGHAAWQRTKTHSAAGTTANVGVGAHVQASGVCEGVEGAEDWLRGVGVKCGSLLASQDHVQIEHWKQLRLQLLVALHSSRPLVCFSLPALNHRPGATPLQEEKDCLAKARSPDCAHLQGSLAR
eukprot:scaffold15147_cov22-Tisochrysis_lutea.AAC.1